jgi:DNA-binding protein HU-beta
VPLVFDSGDSGAYGAERKSSACVVQTGAAPTPKGRIVNKAQLIDAVAMKLDISRRSAGDTVDAVLEGITGAIISGDKVSLTGFGTFETTRRAARTARNPRTGESVDVPAATVPKFRPGQALKDEVNASGGRRRSPGKKTAAKKSAAKKTARTAPANKTAAKKSASRPATKKTASTAPAKATAKKATASAGTKKAAAKKSTARPAARKTATTKAAAKSTPAKKSTAKKTTARKR